MTLGSMILGDWRGLDRAPKCAGGANTGADEGPGERALAAGDADPAGRGGLAGNGEGVVASGVHVGDQRRVVALARVVEEHDVLAWRDSADGLEGLVIGEVAAAAHDAVLEKLRPIAGELQLGAVVALYRKHINTAAPTVARFAVVIGAKMADQV